MKVKLLTSGGYVGMEDFNYNAVLEATDVSVGEDFTIVDITGEELAANGADPLAFEPEASYCFYANVECRIVEEATQ